MARRRFYRLYIGKTLVAQGDVDLIADVMNVSEATARHYLYDKYKPSWLEMRPLPNLFERDGVLLTCAEMAKSLHMSEATVRSAACRGELARGLPIRRYEYETFRLPHGRVQELIEAARKG